MWTDSFRHTAYSSVTSHRINKDFQLKSRVMCTDDFPSDQQKTGANLKTHLLESFAKLGIGADLLKNAVFTTDKGSNILVALRDEERLDCVNHVLNRVLQQSLEEKHCPKDVSALLVACKETVRYVKKTSLQDEMETTLKQACDTRWNSNYTMLESINLNYDRLLTVFTAKKPRELNRITNIKLDLLSALLKFLKPFVTATKSCEGDLEPTLQNVIPAIETLKRHCQVSDDDCENITALKETASSFLAKKFTPHLLHKTAMFFNPVMKTLRLISEEDKQVVMDSINRQLDDLPLREYRPPTAPEQPPPAKRRCQLFDQFNDLPNEIVQVSEVELYLQMSTYNTTLPILEWWKAHAHELPALSRLARSTLCIMASSAPSERNFSVAGHVVSSRRTSLKPSSVNNILFLNSAWKSTA